MAEASLIQASTAYPLTLASAVAEGQVLQLPDGRAGIAVSTKLGGVASSWLTDYIATFVKATGFVALAGGRAYWDHSANAITYKAVGDRDFYVGRFVSDAASDDDTCAIDTKVKEWEGYSFDLVRDTGDSVLVGTPAAGGFGYPVRLGGGMQFELSATSEAQKVDFLGHRAFGITSNPIVEAMFVVISNGSGSAPDFSIGLADGTHASDAGSINQRLLAQCDGNATPINFGAGDGMSISVSLTDSTTDITEGAGIANRVEVWMDLRDLSAVKLYVNGVRVLAATSFDLSAIANPWQPLIHLEKTSAADVYKVLVTHFLVRTSEE